MNIQRYMLTPAMAAVIALWSTNLKAADTASPAPTTMPAPGPLTYNAQAGGCPTCAAGSAGSSGCKGCQSCGSTWFHHHDKGPYVVNLCPGACFGYFQTQWRKWDDVCPYPYQGISVSDAPRPVAPLLPAPTPAKPTGTLPIPQPETKSGTVRPMSYSY
jgi:hypothetical protein